ncbi:MAG: ABC transporter permease [Azospirillaceae bacterium]|nr:ABC transporter permease [Azospirillaceae bacterium]
MRANSDDAGYAVSLCRIVLLAVIGILLCVAVVEHPQDRLVAQLVSYHRVLVLLGQHLSIVASASALAILTAVPAGVLLTRPRFRAWTPRLIGLARIGQAVPGLAVIALSVGLLGVGTMTAILAMGLCSLLPILNNTLTGINAVDPALLAAAHGMGVAPRHVLTRVELPLALAMIMAGIRSAVTINIGAAVLAAFVGGGGLGELIITGNTISRVQVMVLGAALPMLMALAADAVFDMIDHGMKL